MTNSNDNNQRLISAARPSDRGLIIFLHVQPGSTRSQIIGLHDDRLKIAVTKKALDGAANLAVIKLIAESFDLSKSQVTLLKGEKSRQKSVLLQGDKDKLLDKLQKILSDCK